MWRFGASFAVIWAGTVALAEPLANPVASAMAAFNCAAGDDSACVTAVLWRGYAATPADLDKVQTALPGFRAACDAGQPDACGRAGLATLITDPGAAPDAFDLLTRACDTGAGWTCGRIPETLYAITFADAAQTADAARFAAYAASLTGACAGGDISACTNIARLAPHLPDADRDLWRDALDEACDAGSGRACTHLGYLYTPDSILPPDQGLRPNPRRAARLARRGCELGNPTGCYNHGLALEESNPLFADPWRLAQERFAQACLGGEAQGCAELNWESYWRAGDPAAQLDAACAAGDFSACAVAVSDRYAPARPLRFVTDATEAARIREYADRMSQVCDMGSAVACGWAAAILFDPAAAPAAGHRMAYAGCESFREDGNACHLAGLYAEFHGQDAGHLTVATEYYALACDLDLAEGCTAAGYMYEKGRGVPMSLDTAEVYYTDGCDSRNARGCYRLGTLLADTAPDAAARALDRACRLAPDRYCDG